jgi:ribosomal protein S12 methylthiotransferase accessory factor YcaO
VKVLERLIGQINLAPLNYGRRLLDDKIIRNIVTKKYQLLDGSDSYTALVYLAEDKSSKLQNNFLIYGDCSGTGTARDERTAIYKGVSEALERWAFNETCKSGKYGFDVTPNTCGVAAYPGLNYYKARVNAWYEANERWALSQFWLGKLPVKKLSMSHGIECYEIITPIKKISVALLKCNLQDSDYVTYSFAAHSNPKKAVQKAMIELTRNFRVIQAWLKNKTVNPTLLSERRLLFFAAKEGQALFMQAVSKALMLRPSDLSQPKTIVDQAILGPWSTYTKVWRVLYDMPSDNGSLNIFMF